MTRSLQRPKLTVDMFDVPDGRWYFRVIGQLFGPYKTQEECHDAVDRTTDWLIENCYA